MLLLILIFGNLANSHTLKHTYQRGVMGIGYTRSPERD